MPELPVGRDGELEGLGRIELEDGVLRHVPVDARLAGGPCRREAAPKDGEVLGPLPVASLPFECVFSVVRLARCLRRWAWDACGEIRKDARSRLPAQYRVDSSKRCAALTVRVRVDFDERRLRRRSHFVAGKDLEPIRRLGAQIPEHGGRVRHCCRTDPVGPRRQFHSFYLEPMNKNNR